MAARSLQAPGGKGKGATTSGGKTTAVTTTGKGQATTTGKGKTKACTDPNCATCGNGGQCSACVADYGLQGTRCVLCTGANMTLQAATKTKGARCVCK